MSRPAAKRRPRARGVLHVVAGLLMASALLRFGATAGPALAQAQAPLPGATPAALAGAEAGLTAGPGGEQADATTGADPAGLLAALQAREAAVAAREEQIRQRFQALRLAEAEIEDKLAALIAAEEALSATLALADSAAETDLARLTTVYENMKPKEAAALFEEMPPQFAAGFLGMMRPDAAALIMTELEPATAYSFSVVLAGRNANVPTQ